MTDLRDDLSKMAAPVALFSGDHDDMADPTDVSHLMSSLNPSMIVYSTTYTDYEHLGMNLSLRTFVLAVQV